MTRVLKRVAVLVRSTTMISSLLIAAAGAAIFQLVVSPTTALALDSDTYSWPSAPCEFSNGGTSCANPDQTDYPGDKYDWYENSGNPFSGSLCYYNTNSECFDPTWKFQYRNCTDYVAQKINQILGVNLTSGWGNANNWLNYNSTTAHYPTDPTSAPRIGDVAVWTGGTFGHVAYVAAVNGSTATFDEYNENTDGTFTNNYTSSTHPIGTLDTHAPNGYIHIGTVGAPSSSRSTPTAVSRGSNDMDVFYNDGNNNIVNFKWNSTAGWSAHTIADTTNGVSGQPAVVSRTSDSTDTFYYTPTTHKLMNIGWTASGGWTGPNAILTSGVYGDPTVVARDSNDMQVFFNNGSGYIKSIYWTASGGWNTNLQQLYGPGAAGDPYAITRTSDSMDAFFVKSNENLVHLGWTAASGWNSSDWTTYMVGKPTAITWNSGNDMAAFYEQINGNVGEENWDSSTGWAAQTWAASLSGNPSAVAGVSNTIDNFYRETGGNIVDRYLSGSTWATTNIVGSNGSTSNPFAITRGTTSEEVFYWNGTSLMDNNWNTTSQAWNGGAQIN